MPGFIYHVGAVATCPHQAGQITVVSSNTRVFVNGMPAATMADTFTIAGCPFTTPVPKPQPCVTAKFLVPATRVFVNGSPVILQTSTGICQSAEQIPAGPPVIQSTQTRVIGS